MSHCWTLAHPVNIPGMKNGADSRSGSLVLAPEALMTTNQLRRQVALEHYYAAPNYCRECGVVIRVPEGVKITTIRVKFFCNRICANRFNNRLRVAPLPKQKNRERPRRSNRILGSICQRCGTETFSRDGRRKYCDSCYWQYRFPDGIRFPNRTKGELFARRAS